MRSGNRIHFNSYILRSTLLTLHLLYVVDNVFTLETNVLNGSDNGKLVPELN
jgi:hypothetical protein